MYRRNKSIFLLIFLAALGTGEVSFAKKNDELNRAYKERRDAQEKLDLTLERRRQRADRAKRLKEKTEKQWWNIPRRYQRDETLRDLRRENRHIKQDRELVGQAWEKECKLADDLRLLRTQGLLGPEELGFLMQHDADRLKRLESKGDSNLPEHTLSLENEKRYYRALLEKEGESKRILESLQRLRELEKAAGLDG